jgi:hypothetical protein
MKLDRLEEVVPSRRIDEMRPQPAVAANIFLPFDLSVI